MDHPDGPLVELHEREVHDSARMAALRWRPKNGSIVFLRGATSRRASARRY